MISPNPKILRGLGRALVTAVLHAKRLIIVKFDHQTRQGNPQAGRCARLDWPVNQALLSCNKSRVDDWSQGACEAGPRSGDAKCRPLRQSSTHLTIIKRFACSTAVTKARPRPLEVLYT
jgi:hypothetical protein